MIDLVGLFDEAIAFVHKHALHGAEIFQVMAALSPEGMTTVASAGALDN